MKTPETDDSPGAATASAQWRAAGEPDPHAGRYDGERAALTLGSLTDDELANGAFMNYDVTLSFADMVKPKPGQHMPIVWMTAVKDRIRWLSRALERALAATQPSAAPALPDRLLQAFTRRGFRVPETRDDAIASAANIMIEDGCIIDHRNRKLAASGDGQGASAYLMTRPSGFEWPLMPKDMTPEWRAICESEGTIIQALYLAAPGAAITAREQAPTLSSDRNHVTQAGESLMGIAMRQLGDSALWKEIRNLNAAQFPNHPPHAYYPVGTVLQLPPAAVSPDEPGRYRKKPVVIDAYQLPAADVDVPPSFEEWCARVGFTEFESGRDETLVIPTLEGAMTAQPGDWIIKGVKGEFYPCKPGVFAATYEPASTSLVDAVDIDSRTA